MSVCGHPHTLQGMSMGVKGLTSPADHPDHLMLFRTYVSSNAAGKARAVLEGIGLDTPSMDACFSDHLSDEEIAQAGLVKWRDGQGLLLKQPPTWEVLLTAMKNAKIDQKHTEELEEKLVHCV